MIKMYKVEDLIECTVEKMSKAEVVNLAQEYHDEIEGSWPEDKRELKPKTLIESIEYLDVFGVIITKA